MVVLRPAHSRAPGALDAPLFDRADPVVLYQRVVVELAVVAAGAELLPDLLDDTLKHYLIIHPVHQGLTPIF